MQSEYQHLSYGQRYQIQVLKESGISVRRIAAELNCHPSTIYRELKRNGCQDDYRGEGAQQMSVERRSEASSIWRKMTEEKWALVEDRLKQGWSPEQISGRLRREGVAMAGYEWIYRYIRADRAAGGQLFRYLRRCGRKPNWRGGRHSGRGHIPGRQDISQRPAIVDKKSRIGDWEADTIIGAQHKGAIVSVVDRVSKYVVLQKVTNKTAEVLGAALLHILTPFRALVHTITSDNGKEFAGHIKVSKGLDASFYFARPYHSWERGLNEHTNGLVRQYFPKSRSFLEIDKEDLKRVENLLNDRPRKALDFLTPAEVFSQAPGCA